VEYFRNMGIRNPDACIEMARYYLDHEDERRAIAQAGQRRTLTEHTYYHRAQQLLDIVHRYK
jgi:spore maturation protein CgeB